VPKTYNTVSHILYVRGSYKYFVLIKSYSKIKLRLFSPFSLAGLELYVLLQALVLLSAFLAANTHRLLLFAICSSSDPTATSALEPSTSDLLFTVACPLFYLLYSSPIKRLKQPVTNHFKSRLNQS
jgi:hypothetical protein